MEFHLRNNIFSASEHDKLIIHNRCNDKKKTAWQYIMGYTSEALASFALRINPLKLHSEIQ